MLSDITETKQAVLTAQISNAGVVQNNFEFKIEVPFQATHAIVREIVIVTTNNAGAGNNSLYFLRSNLTGDYIGSFIGRSGYNQIHSVIALKQGIYNLQMQLFMQGAGIQTPIEPVMADNWFLSLHIDFIKVKEQVKNIYKTAN